MRNMTISRGLSLALVLLSIGAASAWAQNAGPAVATTAGAPQGDPAPIDRSRLLRGLSLSVDQIAGIDAAFQKYREATRNGEAAGPARARLESEVRALLSAEQRKRYDENVASAGQ